MIAYKLTDKYGYTRKGKLGETFWSEGAVVSPTGKGTKPCGPGVLHAYNHPLTAVLMDPIHARYGNTARLFEIESDAPWKTDGCKRWTTGNCQVLQELELPRLSVEERIAPVIVLVPELSIREWAIRWLSGEDRTEASAWAAARYAWKAEARAAAEYARATAWFPWAPELAAWAMSNVAAAFEPYELEAKIPWAVERAKKVLSGEIPADRAWEEL